MNSLEPLHCTALVTFLILTLCLPYGLSLGLSSLLRHHILHAQTLLVTADLFDSSYDSFLLPILLVFGL
jgi:hypothetical protein